MKALKEKRISLRSLWRRGLVILSLFALVFASCSESGNEEGGLSGTVTNPNPGKIPTALVVLSDPTNVAYMGMPIDLTGVKVQIQYSDASVAYPTDMSKFSTVPAWATGGYNVAGTAFTPLYQYRLEYCEGGANIVFDIITVPDVIPLYRERGGSNQVLNSDPVTQQAVGTFYTSQGLQAVHKAKNMYVDDVADFSGVILEGDYRKPDSATPGQRLEIKLSPTLTPEYITVPYYENEEATGAGGIYVRIGRLPTDILTVPPLVAGNRDPRGVAAPLGGLNGSGLTAIIPVDEVWHVAKVELEKDPELKPFFYWQDDGPPWPTAAAALGTQGTWEQRSRDAVLKVTYSDGKSKSYTVAELQNKNIVWYNFNPDFNILPFAVEGVRATAIRKDPKLTNALVATPNLPLYTKIKEPQIGFYYRGELCWYPVPVYTNFVRLSVVPVGGELVADLLVDNDHRGRDAERFAKKVNVTAVFNAYSDTSLEAEWPVNYDTDLTSETVLGPATFAAPQATFDAASVLGAPADVNLYSMNFGIAYSDGLFSTATTGCGIAIKAKSNATSAVKFYYSTPAAGVIGSGFEGINARVRNISVPVEWINVPKP